MTWILFKKNSVEYTIKFSPLHRLQYCEHPYPRDSDLRNKNLQPAFVGPPARCHLAVIHDDQSPGAYRRGR
jgi:hypothetical protein